MTADEFIAEVERLAANNTTNEPGHFSDVVFKARASNLLAVVAEIHRLRAEVERRKDMTKKWVGAIRQKARVLQARAVDAERALAEAREDKRLLDTLAATPLVIRTHDGLIRREYYTRERLRREFAAIDAAPSADVDLMP